MHSKRALVALIYASLAYISLEHWDPLGAGATSAAHSQDIILKLLAPHYDESWLGGRGRPSEPPPSADNEISEGEKSGGDDLDIWVAPEERDVTVVLVDDSALASWEADWPMTFRHHAGVLNAILRCEPRTLMIDVLFFDRRGERDRTLDQLVNVLDSGRRAGTQIFLGADTADTVRTRVIEPLRKVTIPAIIEWPRSASPLYYPLGGGKAGGRGGDDGAALTIYRHIRAAREQDEVSGPSDEFRHSFAAPMQVFWGDRAPDVNLDQIGRGVTCREVGRNAGVRFLELVRSNLFADQPFYQSCPYPALVPARDLVRLRRDGREVGGRRSQCTANETLAGAIRGRHVFYGMEIEGAADIVETPTHGPTSGVFMHAMALDNLLSLGPRYFRADRPGYLRPLTFMMLFLMALVMIEGRDRAGRIVDAWRKDASRGARVARAIVRRVTLSLLTYGISLALAMGVAMFLFLGERLAPINWLGMFGVSIVVQWVLDDRLEAVLPWLQHKSEENKNINSINN